MRAPVDHVCRACGDTIPAGTEAQLVPGQRDLRFGLDSADDGWFLLCQPCALKAHARWIRDAARKRLHGPPERVCGRDGCAETFEPGTYQQRYCSPVCQRKVANAAKRAARRRERAAWTTATRTEEPG